MDTDSDVCVGYYFAASRHYLRCLPQAALKRFSTDFLVNFSCKADVVKMWLNDPHIRRIKLQLNRP